ncbi:hypothetical protein [Kaarinaea lacus]
MEQSNNRAEMTFNISQIEQLAFPGSMAIYQDIEYFDVTETEIYKEANFCLIPPYCLIEDKEKYLRAAG